MNIDKKFIFNLTVLAAIASTFVACVVPIYSFYILDVYNDHDIAFPYSPWRVDNSYLVYRFTIYDKANIDFKNPTYDSYAICHFLRYETGERSDELRYFNEKITEEPFSYILNNSIVFILRFALLLLFVFICYKIIRDKRINNAKYYLFAGLTTLIILISFIIGVFNFYISIDEPGLGYTNYIKFEYGFYLAVLSTILFFIAYFIQVYPIDIKKEK
jgi:hypothetical protein